MSGPIPTSSFASQLADQLGITGVAKTALVALVVSWDPTTDADLAELVTDFVNGQGVRDSSVNAWLTGTTTGGVGADGTGTGGYYPVGVYGGGTMLLPSPAYLQSTLQKGDTGAPGKSLFAGSGAPASGLGSNGDSYVDTAAGLLYGPKTSGAWGAGVSLIGGTGPHGPAPLLPVSPWATGTAYVIGPPASFVTFGGSSYEALVAHTSGSSFATDLAAGKWGLVAQKGADGTGSGTVTTTGSVTAGHLAVFADATGAVLKDGGPSGPSGSVLQKVVSISAGSSTTSTALVNLTGSVVNITPKSAASTLLVRCSFGAELTPEVSVNNSAQFRLYDAGSGTPIGVAYLFQTISGGGDVSPYAPLSIGAIVSNAALTARSFALRGMVSDASTTVTVYGLVFEVEEIQN